jgi:pilus assembly protein Flp/PilA
MTAASWLKHGRRLLRDESGATAIEYALIASGIAGVIVGAVGALGGKVTAMWATIKAAFG